MTIFSRFLSRIRFLPEIERTYSSVNIFGVKTIYLVSFLAIAASPFYCFGYLYCISFLYIIIDNDILQRALQSVTKNCKWTRNSWMLQVFIPSRRKCLSIAAKLLRPHPYYNGLLAYIALTIGWNYASMNGTSSNGLCRQLGDLRIHVVFIIRFTVLNSIHSTTWGISFSRINLLTTSHNISIFPTGKSLLWVAILLLIIIYIYAVISFSLLRIEFSDPDAENVFCETLDECFVSVLRFGLIDNFLVCLFLWARYIDVNYVAVHYLSV